MKKMFAIQLLFIVLAVTACSGIRTVKKTPNRYENNYSTGELPATLPAKPVTAGYLNSINIRAMRHFTRYYPTATDVKWYSIKNGFMAKYARDSIQTRVDYNRAGNWVFTMRAYHEKKLPKETRGIVKSKYYDDSITLVQEFTTPETLFYLVYLQQGNSRKTVKLCDGVMEVVFKEDK